MILQLKMLYIYFLIKQLPMVNDITNYINNINFSFERIITIDSNLNNDVQCISYFNKCDKLYIKMNISSVMVYGIDSLSLLNYKKLYVKNLKIINDTDTFYYDKNHVTKKIKLNNDLSKCDHGYYNCKLPLKLSYSIL
jgi:hypothetical protein